MLKKTENAEEKFRELLVMALPVAVALIYLYLERGFNDSLSGSAPSVIVGLMLLVISMACRSYKIEESPQVKSKKRHIAVVSIIMIVICCCSAWTDNSCLLPSYVWSESMCLPEKGGISGMAFAVAVFYQDGCYVCAGGDIIRGAETESAVLCRSAAGDLAYYSKLWF